MTIKSRIRSLTKQGAIFPGVILEVQGDKASVRISGNGPTLNGLQVIGGPVTAGQSVIVDFSAPVPIISAIGQDWSNILDMIEAAQKPFTWKILVFRDGEYKITYPPTAEGLASACESARGGLVLVPPEDYDDIGTIRVPMSTGIMGLSRTGVVIHSPIFMMGGNFAHNFSLTRSISSSEDTEYCISSGYGSACVVSGLTIDSSESDISVTNHPVASVWGAPIDVVGCEILGGNPASVASYDGKIRVFHSSIDKYVVAPFLVMEYY